MPDKAEPKFQVGALESPDPGDPCFVDWDAAVTVAWARHAQLNAHVLYPRAVAIWSWPDGDCLAIIYANIIFKPS